MGASFSRLLRYAARVKAQSRQTRRLPTLMFVTDPTRTPNPLKILRSLPNSANGRLGVIYRHFGAPDRLHMAQALAKLCRRRRFVFLIGADLALAAKVRADGVHLPERQARRAAAIKARRIKWIVTLATHGPDTLSFGKNLDALLVSPVFETASAGARGRKILKKRGLSRLARQTRTPIYALGGLNTATISKIEGVKGLAGAAIASGLKP